jgi:hypothetical protein
LALWAAESRKAPWNNSWFTITYKCGMQMRRQDGLKGNVGGVSTRWVTDNSDINIMIIII